MLIVIKLQEMELNANQNILSTVVVVYINTLKIDFLFIFKISTNLLNSRDT